MSLIPIGDIQTGDRQLSQRGCPRNQFRPNDGEAGGDGDSDREGDGDITMYSSQSSTHSYDSALFEAACTPAEKELVSLLLHINTEDLPGLGRYRENFFHEFEDLQHCLTCDCEEEHIISEEDVPYMHDKLVHSIKVQLQVFVLEARAAPIYSTAEGDQEPQFFTQNTDVRELLTEFCEEHMEAILEAILASSSAFKKTLRHASGHKHTGAGPATFTDWPLMSEEEREQEVIQIMQFLRHGYDHDFKRFVNDLIFLVTSGYLRLHDGHENCKEECMRREEIGARLRAVYLHKCLDEQAHYIRAGRPIESLEAILFGHIRFMQPNIHRPMRYGYPGELAAEILREAKAKRAASNAAGSSSSNPPS